MIFKRICIISIALLIIIGLTSCVERDRDLSVTQSSGTYYDESINFTWQNTPDSSCFSEVGYDDANEILYVRFRDSGVAYRYLNFPEDEWFIFMKQESLGGWYNTNIKGKYDCERLSD